MGCCETFQYRLTKTAAARRTTTNEQPTRRFMIGEPMGSRVVFGESASTWKPPCPKTIPDPVALEFTLQRVAPELPFVASLPQREHDKS
jgi:hypothetical protein